MARPSPLHLLPVLIAAASHAGEITIAARPFFVEHSFTAVALPVGEGVLFKLEPKSWSDFKILEVARHGTKAAKGDILLRFDAAEIDEKLEDTRQALATSTLTLQQAELRSKTLEKTSPQQLESIRRAAEIAKEEHAYFTHTRRKAEEETAAQSLKRNEQILSNQREELKQLSKMYEADEITEETEEIILVRQQDAVAAAEFAARMESLDFKRTLEVTLPREAKTLADNERDTALKLQIAEIEIPRSIELNKLELENSRIAQARIQASLAKLEADRKKFEFIAPAEGTFYHGVMENGRWTTGDAVKALVPNGRPATTAALATFIPRTAKLKLIAFLDGATARAIATGQAGIATLAGREELENPVKLVELATVPSPDGTFRADFEVSWSKQVIPTAGTQATIHLISYQQAAAVAIPTQAIQFAPSGWTVEVKLADGKTERRPIKRGRQSKEETEIISGLEIGQVIVVP